VYAACSFAVADAARAPAIADLARAWIWVAAALWLVVAVAALTSDHPLRMIRPHPGGR
jgi:hypothetical protein